MDRSMVALTIVLAVPFVSIFSVRAWSWWGVVATVVGGLVLTVLTYVNQLIVFISGPGPPLELVMIFLTWLIGAIPGSMIGFAIRSIVSQLRPRPKLDGSSPSLPNSNQAAGRSKRASICSISFEPGECG
jgi:hypothetical protein